MKPPSRYSRSLETRLKGGTASQPGWIRRLWWRGREENVDLKDESMSCANTARQRAQQKHAAAWGSGATLLQGSNDKESSFPAPLHRSAVGWVVLRGLVSTAQEMLSVLWEDRLLRHLAAKPQRYYRACMKCNISASINGWHLDRSGAEALTLRLAFCKALSPSSRKEGRDCSGLKKKNISANQNYFHPACFSETLRMNIIFRSRCGSHQQEENAAQAQC